MPPWIVLTFALAASTPSTRQTVPDRFAFESRCVERCARAERHPRRYQTCIDACFLPASEGPRTAERTARPARRP